MQAPSAPTTVDVVPVGGTTNAYTLQTTKASMGLEYMWSYDSLDWYGSDSASANPFATFGNFLSGTPSFQIHVKSLSANFYSPVFSTIVQIPAGNGNCPDDREESTKFDESKKANTILDRMVDRVSVFDILGRIIHEKRGYTEGFLISLLNQKCQ